MSTILIGAGSDLGVSIDGTSLGPKKILDNYNIKKILLEQENIQKSYNKLDLKKNLFELNKFNTKLYNTIKNENDFCLTIGGDHSIAIASAFASLEKYKKLGLVWIDAHLDYNTFQTTITGNLHGLPLATLNGLNEDLRPFKKENFFNPKQTVVVGYRAMEENAMNEINNIKNMGVTVFTTKDIEECGVNKILDLAFKIATNNYQDNLHISFDLDVIDPNICQGVSVPELNGIKEDDLKNIISYLKYNKDIIKSFDLVEYNPLNDKDLKTLEIVKNIIDNIK